VLSLVDPTLAGRPEGKHRKLRKPKTYPQTQKLQSRKNLHITHNHYLYGIKNDKAQERKVKQQHTNNE
jgi:hypothetical protein